MQALVGLALTGMLMFVQMDMNIRQLKQNETAKVDAEIIQAVNEMRKKVVSATGTIDSLSLAVPIGTSNLKVSRIFTDNLVVGADGYTSMRVKVEFARNNVYGPPMIKRDLGAIYCKVVGVNMVGCVGSEAEKVVVAPVPPIEPPKQWWEDDDKKDKDHKSDDDKKEGETPCNR